MPGDSVHANPDDLRMFAMDVRSFAENAEDAGVGLRGRFKRLDWDDDQQRRFGQQLDEAVSHLRRLVLAVDNDLIPYLTSKAAHLERYQGR